MRQGVQKAICGHSQLVQLTTTHLLDFARAHTTRVKATLEMTTGATGAAAVGIWLINDERPGKNPGPFLVVAGRQTEAEIIGLRAPHEPLSKPHFCTPLCTPHGVQACTHVAYFLMPIKRSEPDVALRRDLFPNDQGRTSSHQAGQRFPAAEVCVARLFRST